MECTFTRSPACLLGNTNITTPLYGNGIYTDHEGICLRRPRMRLDGFPR